MVKIGTKWTKLGHHKVNAIFVSGIPDTQTFADEQLKMIDGPRFSRDFPRFGVFSYKSVVRVLVSPVSLITNILQGPKNLFLSR